MRTELGKDKKTAAEVTSDGDSRIKTDEAMDQAIVSWLKSVHLESGNEEKSPLPPVKYNGFFSVKPSNSNKVETPTHDPTQCRTEQREIPRIVNPPGWIPPLEAIWPWWARPPYQPPKSEETENSLPLKRKMSPDQGKEQRKRHPSRPYPTGRPSKRIAECSGRQPSSSNSGRGLVPTKRRR